MIAEAVKRVFDKHGNQNNKARLRFLLAQIGQENFKSLYQCELAKLKKLPRSSSSEAPGLHHRRSNTSRIRPVARNGGESLEGVLTP